MRFSKNRKKCSVFLRRSAPFCPFSEIYSVLRPINRDSDGIFGRAGNKCSRAAKFFRARRNGAAGAYWISAGPRRRPRRVQRPVFLFQTVEKFPESLRGPQPSHFQSFLATCAFAPDMAKPCPVFRGCGALRSVLAPSALRFASGLRIFAPDMAKPCPVFRGCGVLRSILAPSALRFASGLRHAAKMAFSKVRNLRFAVANAFPVPRRRPRRVQRPVFSIYNNTKI